MSDPMNQLGLWPDDDRADHFAAGAKIPKKAHLPGIGHVQVLDYAGKGYFNVLDKRDTRRYVHRDRLKFLP